MTETDATWKLLTVSRGGAVSLIKDLTKREAEFARCRVMGWPATDEEKAAAEARNRERCPTWIIAGPSPTEEDYKRLMAAHPTARGGTFCLVDGTHVSTSGWISNVRYSSDGDIVKAEVFE